MIRQPLTMEIRALRPIAVEKKMSKDSGTISKRVGASLPKRISRNRRLFGMMSRQV
jgi:hypothetical protein